ncbi:MAG: hypothetical protein IKP86_14215, partial [Anaerolineaceae bacterium]|nr:hypothetical protein [Anaerolineaceae bacterium]
FQYTVNITALQDTAELHRSRVSDRLSCQSCGKTVKSVNNRNRTAPDHAVPERNEITIRNGRNKNEQL